MFSFTQGEHLIYEAPHASCQVPANDAVCRSLLENPRVVG